MTDKKKPDTASDDPKNAENDLRPEADTPADNPEPGTGETPAEDVDTGDAPRTEPFAEDGGTHPDDLESDSPDPVAEVEIVDPDDDTVDAEDIEALERLDGDAPGEKVPEAETADDARPAEAEPVAAAFAGREPEPPRPAEREIVRETTVERRGGLLPGFLGGAIAGLGLVFAAPYVIPEKMLPFGTGDLEARVDVQADTITALQSEVESLRGDLAAAANEQDLATVRSDTDTALSKLTDSLAEIREQMASSESLDKAVAGIAALRELADKMQGQIVDLEKRPIAEATDPAAISALKAYESEMATLKSSVEEQMQRAQELVGKTTAAAEASVQKAIEASKSAISDARASAKATEEQAAAAAAAAEEKARQAARAQALVDIQAALETGESFEDQIAALDGIEVPAPLAAVAGTGVATLPELRDAFTIAAREALAASRKETSGDGISDRMSNFVQTHLGLRSLAPMEGDDPDAVLSRAEAATADGQLSVAVGELSALPDGGQQAMADWVAQATARAEALAAADELAASLANN